MGFISMSSCISIHALLAESDRYSPLPQFGQANFYPRSPCGERLWQGFQNMSGWLISIHALLAESDLQNRHQRKKKDISIHALLAESDSAFDVLAVSALLISIHALLAESDFGRAFWPGLSL